MVHLQQLQAVEDALLVGAAARVGKVGCKDVRGVHSPDACDPGAAPVDVLSDGPSRPRPLKLLQTRGPDVEA